MSLKSLGWPEILIILVVVLLFFGVKRLPDLARSMGASAKEFRKGLQEGVEDSVEQGEEEPAKDA
jgi:sec-independent protein translocase protein TatA